MELIYSLLYTLLMNHYVSLVLNLISLIIVVMKFIPGLRIFSIVLQMFLFPIEALREFLGFKKLHPKKVGYTNIEGANG